MKLPGIAALVAYAVTAMPASPPQWVQEPAVVFGIGLGKPFPGASEIADCPVFAPFRREPQSEEVCVDAREAFGPDRIPLQNVPLGGIADKATVLLHGGRVQAIVVDFDPKRYAAMKALLIDRYGNPHAQALQDATDPDGKVRPSETLSWSGSRASILLRELAGHHGHALAQFSATGAAAP